MPVDKEYIGPAIVINIQEERSPAEESHIAAEARLIGYIAKGSIAVVVVERRRVVGKVCLDDVQPAIGVVVRSVGAHSRLLPPISIECHTSHQGGFFESSIVLVAEKKIRSRVASDEDVRPAIIVEISGQSGKAVVGAGFGDAGFIAHIAEASVSIVPEQFAACASQSAGTAHHRDSLPDAIVVAPWHRSF